MPTSQTNVPPDMLRSPSTVAREEDEEVKPYVVVAEIGKGSFATVYKGYHSVSPNPSRPKRFDLSQGISTGNSQASRDKDRQQEQAHHKAIREPPKRDRNPQSLVP